VPEAAIKLSDGFLLRPAQSQFNFLWLMNANNIVMINFKNNSHVDVPDARFALRWFACTSYSCDEDMRTDLAISS